MPNINPTYQDKKGHFKKGNPGGPGRPMGSRNKIQDDFIRDFATHWDKHGAAAIDRLYHEHVDQYCRLAASLVPKNVDVTVSHYDEMSEEEMIERLRTLNDQLRPFLARDVTGRPGDGAQPVELLQVQPAEDI